MNPSRAGGFGGEPFGFRVCGLGFMPSRASLESRAFGRAWWVGNRAPSALMALLGVEVPLQVHCS